VRRCDDWDDDGEAVEAQKPRDNTHGDSMRDNCKVLACGRSRAANNIAVPMGKAQSGQQRRHSERWRQMQIQHAQQYRSVAVPRSCRHVALDSPVAFEGRTLSDVRKGQKLVEQQDVSSFCFTSRIWLICILQ
jgi:hypothetical protein